MLVLIVGTVDIVFFLMIFSWDVMVLESGSGTMIIIIIISIICIWQNEETSQQHQFILHAALDIVEDLAWTTNAM